MNLPKQRIYRAMVRSGVIHENQIPHVNRKLNYDRDTQKQFLHLWRSKKGRLYPGMRGLIKWMKLHQEAILQILGLIILLADEEPETVPVDKVPDFHDDAFCTPRPSHLDALKRFNEGDSIGDVVNEVTDEEDEEDNEEE